MTRGLVTSSKYSPGNLTPEALERLFVGREHLVTEVLKRISASALGDEKHFFLLLGQRGIGKTHLLHFLHHRLTTDKHYAKARKRLKIAFLNEEEWGITSFLDLLMTILRSVEGREQLQGGIEQLYALYAKDPEAAIERAESLLIQHVGSSTLLLICENLIDLFRALGDEGQKRWRAFIQEHPFWTILATSPAMFAGAQLQKSPFYGFFTIRQLEPLELEDAVKLLRQKALVDGRHDLAAFLLTATGRARARAIHRLAGGHHRVYVVMSEFLTKESLDDLVEPFMRMMDDLTPYYQERVRGLASPQQRKIVEFLCRENGAVTVKRIAERCMIRSQQTAAKQIGELAALRIVHRTPVGRETYCEITEPLMRLCFEVKDSRNRHLVSFVELLRNWFTAAELRQRFAALSGPDERPRDWVHLQKAIELAGIDKREPFLETLDDEALRCVRLGDFQQATEATLKLVADRGAMRDYLALATLLAFDDPAHLAMRHAKEARRKFPRAPETHWISAIALRAAGEKGKALAEIDRAIRLRPRDTAFLSWKANLLHRMGRYEEAVESATQAIAVDPTHLRAYDARVSAWSALGRHEEAEREGRELVQRFHDDARAWSVLADALREAGKEEALEAAERAVSLAPDDFALQLLRMITLQQFHRHEEALAVRHRLGGDQQVLEEIELDSLGALNRFAEAEEKAREVLERHPDSDTARRRLVQALLGRQKTQEALGLIERLSRGMPPPQWLRLSQADVLVRLDRYAEALPLAHALVEDPALGVEMKASALMNEIAALVGLDRAEEALAAFEARKEIVSAVPILQRLHLHVATYVNGLHAAIGKLASLSKIEPGTLADMLLGEIDVRGPAAMARALAESMPLLADRHDLLGAGLSGILRPTLKTLTTTQAEWAAALPRLHEILDGIEQCRLPLQVLDAALRLLQDDDQTAMLELPLEVRELVTEALGNGKSGAR